MNNLIEVKLGSMNYEQLIIFSVNNFLFFSLGRPVSGVHQPSGQEAVRPSSPISSQGTGVTSGKNQIFATFSW